MTFQELNLNNPLLNALNDLGLESPTTIQEKVFSVVMSGKDVCAIAQTGTGKTYAYLLPCLRQYQYSQAKVPQLMIIVPTRELVVQVVDAVKELAKYMSLQVIGVYGGVNMKSQMSEIVQGVDVIVGTPGRLFDLMVNGTVKVKNVKRLVIDEFDEMLNLGFRTQLKNIFDKLPERRQNLLFSATLTPEVSELIDIFFRNPERIEAEPSGTPLANISQNYYAIPNFHTKLNCLDLLLKTDESMTKVLVFVATKKLADFLYEHLEAQFGEVIDVIHSNKAQNHRFNSVNQFQSGYCRVLIATDIIARGLDVEEVTHVINFDLPEVPENYIHRIGRTGRVDKKGIAIAFVTENEKEQLTGIESLMNYKIPMLKLPKNLEISEKLLEDEKPKIPMKLPQIKLAKVEKGSAFQEKSEKNSKVNVRRNIEKEKKLKYGKSYRKSTKN